MTLYELIKEQKIRLSPFQMNQLGKNIAIRARKHMVNVTQKEQVQTFTVNDYPDDFKAHMLAEIQIFKTELSRVKEKPKFSDKSNISIIKQGGRNSGRSFKKSFDKSK